MLVVVAPDTFEYRTRIDVSSYVTFSVSVPIEACVFCFWLCRFGDILEPSLAGWTGTGEGRSAVLLRSLELKRMFCQLGAKVDYYIVR